MPSDENIVTMNNKRHLELFDEENGEEVALGKKCGDEIEKRIDLTAAGTTLKRPRKEGSASVSSHQQTTLSFGKQGFFLRSPPKSKQEKNVQTASPASVSQTIEGSIQTANAVRCSTKTEGLLEKKETVVTDGEQTALGDTVSTGGSKEFDRDDFNPGLVEENELAWNSKGPKNKYDGAQKMSLFAVLADTWESLEKLKNTGTGSRTKAITILCNYFRLLLYHCPQEIVMASFLTLHRVAPDYCGIEIGLGESLLIKTLCETYGRKESQVKQSLKELGDLGSIATESRVRMTTLSLPCRLALKTVFFDLGAIAELKGANAQSRKREKVKKLLVSAIDLEPKFIIRFLEKQLRIGVKLQAVLVALAWAFTYTPPQNRLDDEELNNVHIRNGILKNGVTEDFLEKFSRVQCTSDIRLVRITSHGSGSGANLADRLTMMEAAIKQAYSQVPNLAFVLFWLLLGADAERLSKECVICPGVPVAPMLAKPTKGLTEVMNALEGLTFRAEYKYDGERIQIHKMEGGGVHLFSRNMEVLDVKYPDVREIALEAANPDTTDFILDAEVVAINTLNGEILPFQTLSGRKRKDVDISTLTINVAIFVFDCLRYNGSVLVNTPLTYRREKVKDAAHEIPNKLLYARGGDVSDVSALEALLSEAIDGKTEGLMVKVLDGERSHYEPSKRSMNWLKLKKDYLDNLGDSLDLVPIGAFWGRGKRNGQFGAYLLAVYDGDDETYRTVCKVATGFTDEDLTNHHTFFSDKQLTTKPFYYHVSSGVEPEAWLSAAQVWECKAADLSISPVHTAAFDRKAPGKGIGLRFPRYLRIREDKRVESATGSDQILEMYEKQFASGKQAEAAENPTLSEEDEDEI